MAIPLTRTLSLTHSLTHALTLTHSLTNSLTHSLIHSLTRSLAHSLTHSLTHLLTHSLTHSLTRSLTHSLTHCHSMSLAFTYSLSLLHAVFRNVASAHGRSGHAESESYVASHPRCLDLPASSSQRLEGALCNQFSPGPSPVWRSSVTRRKHCVLIS